MTDCVFCKIVEGTLPAEKVYEDEQVMAFHDANPTAPIHILIVPRKHVPTLNHVSEDEQILSHMGKVARKIAEDFGVDQVGYRFVINVNRGGGQMVFHLHAHVIAGADLGTSLIKYAVVFAVLWRKLVRLVRGREKT